MKQKNRLFCHTLSLVVVGALCMALILPLNTIIVFADEVNEQASLSLSTDYQTYYEKTQEKPWGTDTVSVEASALKDSAGAAWPLQTEESTFAILQEGKAGGLFKVEISNAGKYQFFLEYKTIASLSGELEIALYIDGVLPFDECSHIVLNRCYVNDATPFEEDVLGNQIRPVQTEIETVMGSYFTDRNGYFATPYAFYLEEGMHTIEMRAVAGDIGFVGLNICPSPVIKTYAQVWDDYQKNGYVPATESIRIEGETAEYKSDSTLYPTSDRLSCSVSPSDPARTLLNTIGQNNWKTPGQTLTFKVDVQQAGLYAMSFRVKQNVHRGMVSSRKLLVDGEVPYQELEAIAFPFAIDWYMHSTRVGDTPCALYLSEGVHTLTMEVTTGVMAQVLRQVEKTVYNLNTLYRKILMITGSTPDTYRDYSLEKSIPGLIENLKDLSNQLRTVVSESEHSLGLSGTEFSLLLEMSEQLDSFSKSPASIPSRLDAFKSNITSLGTWLTSVREQPLELDYIELYPFQGQPPKGTAGFWSELIYNVRAFFASFITDYNMVGVMKYQEEDAKTITAWINSGRDQAQILRRMIDDRFTPSTGIAVALNLVSSNDTLIQATLADKGPDVALLVSSDLPVNLAKRGALCNLSDYVDFANIESRFDPSSFIKFRYGDGVYAIPNTQEFMMMFYRKDIFAELGLKAPTTWKQLYELLPQLQRKHMTVGIPSTDQSVFEMLLYQKGGTLFTEDLTKTRLDTVEALEAFKMWTGFFSEYSFPLSYDFYNRFRTGEMPIGLSLYSMYNTLSTLAPELDGLWEMLPVPGFEQSDGNINNTVTSSGLASVMLSNAKDKVSGYRFLDWWTTAESQTRFGLELEGVLGASGRYCAANLQTMEELPWKAEAYEQLMAQWKNVTATPQLPSSYEVTRNILNAFRMVVYNGQNERETLNIFSGHIDEEIKRKNQQRGNGAS